MAENTSQTKLTPFQKLKRVVSRRSVDNLGSKLSLDKYIQPDDTDNEILFNSNTYKPDYWNISTESPPIWFEPKVSQDNYRRQAEPSSSQQEKYLQ